MEWQGPILSARSSRGSRLRHARTTLWMLAGLALPLGRASGDDVPPPTPVGLARTGVPTWDQALDGEVDQAQAPGTPPAAPALPPPATAPPTRRPLSTTLDPNNPFASL